MGLYIVEFQTARDRRVVRAGEDFQVRLEAEWDPPGGAGEEEIRLYCKPTEFSVEPRTKLVRIAAEEDTMVCTFRIKVTGPRSDKVDVYAESKASVDAICLQVEK